MHSSVVRFASSFVRSAMRRYTSASVTSFCWKASICSSAASESCMGAMAAVSADAGVGQAAASSAARSAVAALPVVAGAPFDVACMSGLDEGASDGMVCSLVKWSQIGCDCSV